MPPDDQRRGQRKQPAAVFEETGNNREPVCSQAASVARPSPRLRSLARLAPDPQRPPPVRVLRPLAHQYSQPFGSTVPSHLAASSIRFRVPRGAANPLRSGILFNSAHVTQRVPAHWQPRASPPKQQIHTLGANPYP